MNATNEIESIMRLIVGDYNPNHDPKSGQFVSTGGGSQSTRSSGWDYSGIREQVDKLEKALSTTKSINRINSIAKSLREQDKQISIELNRLEEGTADVPGDKSSLLTLRRRVRQLMQKASY